MSPLPVAVREAAARVRVLALDVDGVLTSGQLHYGPEGEEVKTFHVRDGLGIRLLLDNGIEVALITARQSAALTRRASDLGIRHVFSGRRDKRVALHELCQALDVKPDSVAYAGDDLLDVPVLQAVGLAISVADGHFSAHRAAHWVTSLSGGSGAVREMADALLEARGELEAAHTALLASLAR